MHDHYLARRTQDPSEARNVTDQIFEQRNRGIDLHKIGPQNARGTHQFYLMKGDIDGRDAKGKVKPISGKKTHLLAVCFEFS